MKKEESIKKIISEIRSGMKLSKCKQCGCMEDTLKSILKSLSLIKAKGSLSLIKNIKSWLKEMEDINYTCLGCDYCYPAVAMNIMTSSFSSTKLSSLSCNLELKENTWPLVAGEYFVLCEDSNCPVAVSTLASIELAEALAKIKPKGLCIVGKTETENIGIDKVIKNIITNPNIHYLVVAGRDSKGHYSGRTLISLSKSGVDRDMRIIGAPGRQPILKNTSISEVECFRRQVQIIDMIDCIDTRKIINKIDKLSIGLISTCECKECYESISSIRVSTVPRVIANEPKKIKMDKEGYFVVIPSSKKKIIVVEHYTNKNKLLHTIEGKDAPSIYSTIIENGWVTQLSHAAYLGRELARAEFNLSHEYKYIQDKAPGKAENKKE